ncbi:MAG: hypothetical protein IPK07_13080 [Deltaproteobacteria bacterium]|nr:hypothetical protein [Deltaproteobacteria bacterium]
MARDRAAPRDPRSRRGARGFSTTTLLTLPYWAEVGWIALALTIALLSWKRRLPRRLHPGVLLGAATIAYTSGTTWLFWGLANGCGQVLAQPGTLRLDTGSVFDDGDRWLRSRGEYSVDVDPEERFAYVSYSHGGSLRGVARLSLDGSVTTRIGLGAGGILHARFEPLHRRIWAVDHYDKNVYVLATEPLALERIIATGSDEPMDVAFDVPSRRAYVIDRSERPESVDRKDLGLLIFDLDDPGEALGRLALPKLPGANEFIRVPGERRAFITSEGFITLGLIDFATLGTRSIVTGLPGSGGGAVDTRRRDLYLTHPIGWLHVRDADDGSYRRSLYSRGVRAVAYDAARDAVYVSDFFNGFIKRIEPASGKVLGRVRMGPRMRQMKVLRDGRLLTTSACGVVVIQPP